MSARIGARRDDTQGATKGVLLARKTQGVQAVRSAIDASSPVSRQREEVMSTSPKTLSVSFTHALRAQWSLLQQNICLGHIPVTAERDLLRLLESLPEHRNTILSDIEGVLPYLLAFAVAPIPSERTQAIALKAIQAIISSLVAVWGRKAVAVLLHDFLVVEHNALRALEVTISVVIGDEEELEKSLGRHRGMRKEVHCSTVSDTRRAIIGGALELLLTMVIVSKSTAANMLKHAKLIQIIVRHLPKATPVQACDVANILYSLSAIDGAAEALVGYKVYHAAVLYIFSSMRDGGSHGEISPDTTVTALCVFLRLVVRLTCCAAAFTVLQEYPSTPHVMEKLLCSHWEELVELGSYWLISVMEWHMTQCAGLVSDILSRTQIGERLANMVLGPSNMVKRAATAALCWRWFALVNPAVTSSFMASNPNVMFSLMQVISTALLPPKRETAEPEDKPELADAASQVVTDVVCTLGICYGLGSRETRLEMRRLILHRLSPLTQAEVVKCAKCIIANEDDSYFVRYPLVKVPRRGKYCFATSQSGVNLMESASESDQQEGEEEDKEDYRGNLAVVRRHVGSENQEMLSLCSSSQWRSFLLLSLTRLFRGTAGATSILCGEQLGRVAEDASAVRHVSTLMCPSQKTHSHHRHRAGRNCTTICPPPLQCVVVQRAEQLGGTFYLDSIRVILRLAHRYRHSHMKEKSQFANLSRSSSSSAAAATTTTGVAAVARPGARSGKEPNPWAPPEKVEPSRRWCVEDVQRSDILLFYVSYENITTELAQALQAVEEQTRNLGQCLQLCPTKAVQRRCLLNDLYMHVYPRIHMCLQFIQHHTARSQYVLHMISERKWAVHSGNILEIYDAVGHCIGTSGVPKGGGVAHSMQARKSVEPLNE